MKDADSERLADEVARAVEDPRVLAAIRDVPRAEFVPEAMRDWAFEDMALPIGHGQTISQPTIVGLMTEALQLSGSEHVLEIGTGSGYQAAILARLAKDVVSVEVVSALRTRSAGLLRTLGANNVEVVDAGERLGAPERGPYDRIIVTAACPAVPACLVDQLALGGLLVLPVGSRTQQDLIVARKTESGLVERSLGGCRFVPLVGPEGFEPRGH
jgi:protein-L-isoaspartate(D-aspartate) O-methyltransferase